MPETPVVVTSNLWKFLQLTQHSSYFSALVRAATLMQGREFSEDLVAHVATSTDVLDAVVLDVTDGLIVSVDVVLEQLAAAGESTLDDAITAAVAAYEPSS